MKPRMLAIAALLIATPAFAQSAPASVADVITICTPVIDEEYKGDTTHMGVCVKATTDYLTTVYGPPPTVTDPNSVVADLVAELITLYRAVDCPTHPTELPDAIRAARSFSTDTDQQAELDDIAQTVQDCADVDTAAITASAPLEESPN